jgi:hypothetical protein
MQRGRPWFTGHAKLRTHIVHQGNIRRLGALGSLSPVQHRALLAVISGKTARPHDREGFSAYSMKILRDHEITRRLTAIMRLRP